jgi:hypothetical protein
MEYRLRVNYTDSINSYNDLEGVIRLIGWSYAAIDNGVVVADIEGEVEIAEPSADSFTPLNDVTLPQIEGWVLSIIDEEQLKTKVNSML